MNSLELDVSVISVFISFLFINLSYFKTRRRTVLVNGHQTDLEIKMNK